MASMKKLNRDKQITKISSIRLTGDPTPVSYSTIRIERRVADMVRQVAQHERQGKSLTAFVERLLRVYVAAEHPELEIIDDRAAV